MLREKWWKGLWGGGCGGERGDGGDYGFCMGFIGRWG